MLQSTIHQDDPAKSLKILSKNSTEQRMLTQTINFFEGVTTFRKICRILYLEMRILLQLAVFH